MSNTVTRAGRVVAAFLLTIVFATLHSVASWAQSSPKRIVSLTPGITETLYALRLGGHVVGDTDYCDYPANAKLKPHIGGIEVNYEALLSLRPDLVIADAGANASAITRLRALRVPLLIITSRSLGDVESMVSVIGQRTGTTRQAQAVLGEMNHEFRLCASIAKASSGRAPARVLVTVGLDPLYVAGTNSFMGDMVSRGGGVDVAGVAGSTGYTPWSKEQAIASRPQAIFCDAADKRVLLADMAWRQTPAVRLGNIFVTNDAYMRPGPRIADAAVAVADDLCSLRR